MSPQLVTSAIFTEGVVNLMPKSDFRKFRGSNEGLSQRIGPKVHTVIGYKKSILERLSLRSKNWEGFTTLKDCGGIVEQVRMFQYKSESSTGQTIDRLR